MLTSAVLILIVLPVLFKLLHRVEHMAREERE
jgi:hypothetical protein